ncbi:hypothetical protein N7474_004711 [Penicillium riverlandense]|uniref:uncharacterized protein n=1 Tax=Penicillium riverlandense TaxID=1903569 RepID=UPI002546711D|nr:uncharacterized protein N7474_004711 [Penicillium riverlandense]KAJ5819120.1 hypothetical protein N7474_004711 [Penicillium riverlandense]
MENPNPTATSSMKQALYLAYSQSSYGLQSVQRDATKRPLLLLTVLTDLEEAGESALVNHINKSPKQGEIQKWKASEELLHSITTKSDLRDSMASLYGLAILAYQVGHSRLVVADNLTKRQLEGMPAQGESSRVSVVMVAIKPGKADGQVRVIAKRDAVGEDGQWPLWDTLEYFDISQEYILGRLYGRPDIYDTFGLELHDPDRTVFTPEILTSLGRDDRQEDMQQPIVLPPWLRFDRDELTQDIFLSFPSTVKEREKLHSVLQEGLRNQYLKTKEEMENRRKENKDGVDNDQNSDSDEIKAPTVRLLPWEHDHIASRRDLMRIREACRSRDSYLYGPRSLNFLLEPIRGDNVTSAQFGTLLKAPTGIIILRKSLDQVVKEVLDSDVCGYEEIKKELENNGRVDPSKMEIMQDPAQPFYPNLPPWLPIDRKMNGAPLFYLTNKVTKQKQRALQDEIQALNSFDVDDHPWEKQSFVDNTVVVADTLYYHLPWASEEALKLLEDVPEPSIKGFAYGRIPGRDAHTVYANLSIANMQLDEFFWWPRGRDQAVHQA